MKGLIRYCLDPYVHLVVVAVLLFQLAAFVGGRGANAGAERDADLDPATGGPVACRVCRAAHAAAGPCVGLRTVQIR